MINLKPIKINPRKDTDICTILGPWLGEFGPELIYWQGYVRRYCMTHNEHVIVISREENSCVYELADEFWSIEIDRDLEPNFNLPGRGFTRKQMYRILEQLYHQGYEFDKVAFPDRVHESKELKFRDPTWNQSFIQLDSQYESLISREVSEPYILVFIRDRTVDPKKNWDIGLWKELVEGILDEGYKVVFGGGYKSRVDLPGIKPWTWGIEKKDWLDLQIGLVNRCQMVISGESGTGFFPGLCLKPGIIFGNDREKGRYEFGENIFSAPIVYINKRDPSPDIILRAIKRMKNEHLSK